MLEIDDKLISLDILEKTFTCDLSACKGNCCVHGDSGAPLEKEEIEAIKDNYDIIKTYMTNKGIDEINKQGFSVVDNDGDTVTPLINNLACAYIYYDGDLALCAIEKAFLDKKIKFHKPISCHLYPIRLTKYKNFTAVNYDKWDICKPAIKKGKSNKTPLYKFLEGPLKRKFGEDFYEQLAYAAENLDIS
jgi:hypothetical protein